MRLYYITGQEAANEIQQDGFEDEGIHLGLYNAQTREPVYHQGILLMGMNPWDIDLGQEEGSILRIERVCS